MHGKLILDKPVAVAHYKTRRQRQDEFERAEREFKNVFVKNLPKTFTEAELRTMFEKYGTIVSLALKMEEEDPTKCKGYGFVSYEDTDSAHKAVDALNDTEVAEGQKLYVGRAMKKSERAAMLRRKYEQLRAERSRVQVRGV